MISLTYAGLVLQFFLPDFIFKAVFYDLTEVGFVYVFICFSFRVLIEKKVEVEALVLAMKVKEVIEVTCCFDINACRCIHLIGQAIIDRCTRSQTISWFICIHIECSECILIWGCCLIS